MKSIHKKKTEGVKWGFSFADDGTKKFWAKMGRNEDYVPLPLHRKAHPLSLFPFNFCEREWKRNNNNKTNKRKMADRRWSSSRSRHPINNFLFKIFSKKLLLQRAWINYLCSKYLDIISKCCSSVLRKFSLLKVVKIKCIPSKSEVKFWICAHPQGIVRVNFPRGLCGDFKLNSLFGSCSFHFVNLWGMYSDLI